MSHEEERAQEVSTHLSARVSMIDLYDLSEIYPKPMHGRYLFVVEYVNLRPRVSHREFIVDNSATEGSDREMRPSRERVM
jgi:hypothetical protein